MTTGHRLPEDWLPSPEQQDYARQQGVTDVSRMAEDFIDYWVAKAGKDARKTDWNRTWKTWARREGDKCREKAAREARFNRPSPGYQPNQRAMNAGINALLLAPEEPAHEHQFDLIDYQSTGSRH